MPSWEVIAVGLLLTYVTLSFLFRKITRYTQMIRRRREVISECLKVPETENIFVVLPSYRDLDTGATIYDLFHQSSCPHRIFIGLCIQNYPSDPDPIKSYLQLAEQNGIEHTHEHNVRILRIDPEQATGYLKIHYHILSQLYRKERYILHIHSHTMLTKHWDRICRDELIALKNVHAEGESKKVVCPMLTTRPSAFLPFQRHTDDNNKKPVATFTKFSHFQARKVGPDQSVYIPITTSESFLQPPTENFPSLFWCSQFSFTFGEPFYKHYITSSQHFHFYDFVETEAHEFFLGAYLWSHSFQFYAPRVAIVQHRFFQQNAEAPDVNILSMPPIFIQKRQKEQLDNPVFAHDHEQTRKNGYKQWSHMLTALASGTAEKRKSLAQYLEYCGIDILRPHASAQAQLGLESSATGSEMLAKYGSVRGLS
jgi:hypothetical protein